MTTASSTSPSVSKYALSEAATACPRHERQPVPPAGDHARKQRSTHTAPHTHAAQHTHCGTGAAVRATGSVEPGRKAHRRQCPPTAHRQKPSCRCRRAQPGASTAFSWPWPACIRSVAAHTSHQQLLSACCHRRDCRVARARCTCACAHLPLVDHVAVELHLGDHRCVAEPGF